ncbi:hypothetical protein K461DRAFT_320558 [Myriangium duriaei CBS 260.36]|uniref:histidine kinase n=1 Tax=Myriangium duriaei CBS 260.36 TaxID=1168546 RepID=A0A9P4MH75_9PEZI|nr:hypothetical protein K461DRAFT_320558 [Myriangium duriaei CBS 260.36]
MLIKPSFEVDTNHSYTAFYTAFSMADPLTPAEPVIVPPDTPIGAPLDSVGILEFLNLDINPVLVFDLQQHCLTFENNAFRDWKQANPREFLAFAQPPFLDSVSDFNISTPNNDFVVANRTWRATSLRKRWIVMTSHNDQSAMSLQAHPVPPTPPANPTVTAFQTDSAPASGRTSRASPALSAASPSVPATWDTFNPAAKPLDWTRYDVSNLSAHVLAVKKFPWETTSIGGIDSWSDTFRATVIAMCANSEARILLWGPEHTMIYNEACAPLFGQKHPLALGGKAEDIWSEAWPALGVFVAKAETDGIATRLPGIPLTMQRHGYDEETFWIANFVPIIGPKGKALGVLDEFTELTLQVVQDRRRDVVMKTSEILSRISRLEELWDGFLQGIQRAHDDVPYAGIYVPTDSNHWNPTGLNTPLAPLHRFTLRGTIGLDQFSSALPDSLDLAERGNGGPGLLQACRAAWKLGDVVSLRDDEGTLPAEMAITVQGRAMGHRVKSVCVFPISDLIGNNQLAFAVLALTPRRPFDANATGFIRSLADVLARSASTIFLPDEQRRARQRFEEIETALSQRLEATSLEAERVEAQYERLVNQVPIGIFVLSPDEELLYHNKAYLSFTSSRIEKAGPSGRQDSLIHEKDQEYVAKMWKACVELKQPYTIEYRVQKEWRSVDVATGKEISGESWVLASAVPELDNNGNVTQIMGWMLDISDRKYHEKINLQRLGEQRAEARFARLAETAPMGMYLLKPNSHPLYMNDAYFDVMGFSRAEYSNALERGVVGWADHIFEEDRALVDEVWRSIIEEGAARTTEFRVKKPWRTYDNATGTYITGLTWVQSTAFAELDDAGNVLAIQGFVTEISMKKFSERLLSERLEEALETKRQADRFIDMTSHEMRNPLSAILQSADGILTAIGSDHASRSLSLGHQLAIDSEEVVETVVDAAQTIVLCAQHQKRIVDDILTLSKLDSNLLVISPDKSHVPTLIQRCFKMYEAELDRVEIEARLEIEEGYREMAINNVMLDSSRVLQVIINLLTNAIKFTQHADTRRITIFLDASSSRPHGKCHNAQFIEQRAQRPDLTLSAEWGKGEELYLQIAVQDSGRGLNEEELKLLFHRFSQASPKTYKQYGGSGLGLFISRELTELQGGQIGVHSQAGAGSTFTFYVKAKRVDGDDGIVVLDEPIGYRTPAALSRAQSRDGPMSDTGFGSLAPAIPQRRPSVLLRKPAPLPKVIHDPQSTLNVLVVEDNEINQRVMANQLRRLGCTVHLASHGLECLDFLERTDVWCPADTTRRLPAGSKPIHVSVVLMDLEMPVLGGLGCVKRIRELQKDGRLVRHLPVIAVTANARSEQIAVALQHGMDQVVTKPFRIPDLVPQMEELVKRVALTTVT